MGGDEMVLPKTAWRIDDATMAETETTGGRNALGVSCLKAGRERLVGIDLHKDLSLIPSK